MNRNENPDMNLGQGDEHTIPALEVSDLRRSLRSLMKPAITVEIDTPIREAIRLM